MLHSDQTLQLYLLARSTRSALHLVDGAALGVGVQLGAPTASDPMLTASSTQAVHRQLAMRLSFGRSLCVLCATLFFATWRAPQGLQPTLLPLR